MKIWQRIFLLTLMVAIAAIMIQFVSINKEFHNWLQQEVENSGNLHKEIYSSFEDRIETRKVVEMNEYLDSETYQDLAAQSIRAWLGTDYGIKVVVNDEFSCTNYQFYPMGAEMNVKNTTTAMYKIVEWMGSYQLVYNSKYIVDDIELKTVSHIDVSHVYDLYVAQLDSLERIGVILLVEAILILLIMVHSLLIPLKKVRKGISDITAGNYGKQLKTSGNTEITELIRDINQMSEEISANIGRMKEMAENRRIFIGNMAHEMKTPLTAILGFADILTIMPDISDEQKREYSEHIYREALRLRGMSGKLMELVQLQENNVQAMPVNLKELVSEVVDTESVIFGKADISLEVDLCDAVIDGDSDLLKSLFYNLLDNAKKATNNGEKIELIMKKENESVQIKVKDYGIGIPKDEIKKIVEPFYMVDKSRSRKSGGAGLGLALCQTIVALHNGTMEIDSEEGKGCTVVVTLPILKGVVKND